MESATALLTLHALAVSIDDDDPHDLNHYLSHAANDFRGAVASYCGLQLTLTQHHHPVVLAVINDHPGPDDAVRASLRLPLTLVGPEHEPGSRIVLFAGTTGAFVDLAADLDHLLTPPGADRRRPSLIVLDADLPPSTTNLGLTGIDELSTINRAIGFMIDTGHHPDEAHLTLQRQASNADLTPHQWAHQLLHTRPPSRAD